MAAAGSEFDEDEDENFDDYEYDSEEGADKIAEEAWAETLGETAGDSIVIEFENFLKKKDRRGILRELKKNVGIFAPVRVGYHPVPISITMSSPNRGNLIAAMRSLRNIDAKYVKNVISDFSIAEREKLLSFVIGYVVTHRVDYNLGNPVDAEVAKLAEEMGVTEDEAILGDMFLNFDNIQTILEILIPYAQVQDYDLLMYFIDNSIEELTFLRKPLAKILVNLLLKMDKERFRELIEDGKILRTLMLFDSIEALKILMQRYRLLRTEDSEMYEIMKEQLFLVIGLIRSPEVADLLLGEFNFQYPHDIDLETFSMFMRLISPETMRAIFDNDRYRRLIDALIDDINFISMPTVEPEHLRVFLEEVQRVRPDTKLELNGRTTEQLYGNDNRGAIDVFREFGVKVSPLIAFRYAKFHHEPDTPFGHKYPYVKEREFLQMLLEEMNEEEREIAQAELGQHEQARRGQIEHDEAAARLIEQQMFEQQVALAEEEALQREMGAAAFEFDDEGLALALQLEAEGAARAEDV